MRLPKYAAKTMLCAAEPAHIPNGTADTESQL